MSDENSSESTRKSSSNDDGSGVIIVIVILLAILSGLYTQFRMWIDILIIITGSVSLVALMYYIYLLATKYNIQFDKQEILLLSSLALLWVPLIGAPLCDLILPSVEYFLFAGLRMLGLLLILIGLIANIICSSSFVSLYEKSFNLKKPNWVEKKILVYRWPWISIMYFVTVFGFVFGSGIYESLIYTISAP